MKVDILQNLWAKIVNVFASSDSTDESPNEQAPKYDGHQEAVIIACYFNPTKSPARRLAFDRFYDSIAHLQHRIIECVIGDGATPELPENSEYISQVHTKDMLWHKESLINRAIAGLPKQFRYIFWIDADVLFTNQNWLPQAVARLEADATVVQPFEFGYHLDEGEGERPSLDLEPFKALLSLPTAERGGVQRHPRLWRSFASNWESYPKLAESNIYDEHGHVGFAWGARRELLEAVPLYDRALVGGADHIIAHAAVGQIPSSCIDKSFTADLEEVYEWSRRFADVAMRGRLAYVPGDVYHLWHGDLKKRDYLNRIKEFTPIAQDVRLKDSSGLYTTDDSRVTDYVENYLKSREVNPPPSVDEFFNAGITPVVSDEGNFTAEPGVVNSPTEMPAAWTGFGGGGDFDGGGAGGEWSESSFDSTSPSPQNVAAAEFSEISLSSNSSENFS